MRQNHWKHTRTALVSALLALLCLTVASPASGIFLQPPSVPADRLIKNISAYLEENPDDAEAHFLLARVHYIAFVKRSTTIKANKEGSETQLPNIVDPRQQWVDRDAEKIDDEKAVEHARAAIKSFKKALALDQDNALYHLGLAGIYEQSASLAGKIDPNPEPEEGEDADADQQPESERFIDNALAQNLTAYHLDRDEALKKRSVFLPFYPVAYEAGKAALRLVEAHDLKLTDDKVAQQIKDDLAAIDRKPKAITPIVLRVEGETPESLDDLIAKDKTVRFDLDADGVAERRPWVNPDTAILVWDPEHTGEITSGKQLFGNMTFFMLFSDGYRALDVLDDDRDGKLAGDELAGLALWHDRNTNGVSEPGEVTPIRDTPVRSIATTPTGKVNALHPMNHAGVTLDDGSARPTWDWVIPAAPGN
jgi:hypothetical protein